MTKVVDTFIFHNELDMLNFRLHELSDVVDYFVLVEASTTFKGDPKPFYYKDNKLKFSQFNNKIIHIEIDIPKDLGTWGSQSFQRNQILSGLSKFEDNDAVLLSDVDEIPTPNELQKTVSSKDYLSFNWVFYQDIFYGNFKNYRGKWGGSYLTSVKDIIDFTPELCRKRRRRGRKDVRRIFNGGWHLSYFGDAEFISHKIQNLSSQNLNVPEFTDVNKIEYRLDNLIDFFDRETPRNSRRWVKKWKEGSYIPHEPRYKHLLEK